MAKSSARQYLVKVAGIEGYFMTKSGGNISSDVSKVYDGGSLTPDLLTGPAEADNITVSRAYDPLRDAKLLAKLRKDVGRFTATVSVTPTDRNLAPLSKVPATVYSKATLIGLTEPDMDASSGDASTYELEFAVGSYA